MANFDPRGSSNSVSSTRSGSRHQIKRSLTEFAAPVRLGRSSRKDRFNDGYVPQSPISNPPYLSRFSLDMPRSEGVTPIMSAEQSRRPSVMLQREEENRVNNGTAPADPGVNLEKKLLEERERASCRVDGLKQSLDQLGTFSMSTSRKLDETYYSVLEKLSALQSTMAALKELAETSRNIHRGFDRDSREIENDITLQLASFGQFKDQQGSIESLQTRIQNGRAKIRSLSDRVDIVRERVESWDRADKEWQERTRKRLKTIWIFFSIIALTMTLVSLGAQYVPPHLSLMHLDSTATKHIAESIISSRTEASHTPILDDIGEDTLRKEPGDGAEGLRLFDEL